MASKAGQVRLFHRGHHRSSDAPLTAGCRRGGSRRERRLRLNLFFCGAGLCACRAAVELAQDGSDRARRALWLVGHAGAQGTGNCDPRWNAVIAVATAAKRAALARTGAARAANHDAPRRPKPAEFRALGARLRSKHGKTRPKPTANSPALTRIVATVRRTIALVHTRTGESTTSRGRSRDCATAGGAPTAPRILNSVVARASRPCCFTPRSCPARAAPRPRRCPSFSPSASPLACGSPAERGRVGLCSRCGRTRDRSATGGDPSRRASR